MRLLLSAACTLSLLAHAASAQSVPPTAEPALGDTILQLNVEGGRYMELETGTVGNPIDLAAELAIERINEHPKWAARSSVCVRNASSDYQACVHVSQRYSDGRELVVNRTLYKDHGKTLVSSEPVQGSFEVGSKIAIGVRSGADTIEFKVGAGPWLMQALPFSPKSVYMSCSSALCRLLLR